MDGWSKIQLARMKNGGNGKLKKFWSQQKFPKNLSPKQRLDNNAMDKYRERLLSLAKGEQPDAIPYIGYQERQIVAKNNSYSNLNSANSSSSSLHSNGSNNNGNRNRPKMQGFGNTGYNPNDNNDQQKDTSWDDFWNSASSLASKTTAVASDIAQKAKVNAVSLTNKAAEKTATIKSKLGDEEYQANIKKNAAETWTKTTSTLSSWWSTAATSVTNVINENFNEGKDDGVKLYNKDGNNEMNGNMNNNNQNNQNHNNIQNNPNRKKMPSLSSDQYFNKDTQQNQPQQEDILGMNNNNNRPQQSKKKHIDDLESWNSSKQNKNKNKPKPNLKKKDSDDFDDWGFGDDEDEDDDEDNNKDIKRKQEIKPVMDITEAINGSNNDKIKKSDNKPKQVESLLDFDQNENVKDDKDGNSSDELDAFFNEMELDEDKSNDKANNNNNKKKKSNNDDVNDLLTSHTKSDDIGDDDWGFAD
eukprot:CAMPEP_0201567792 /NCGR_PEP_ID=MMETSP0190_2-20130828/8440_1 /ASSEMBLY_ACC=CAM_ASM_000263 /TAXON_ID=37353 /ORGANISM="Rosalina sp." /LENGTH=471 /DNA_ID=CAMNT_0047988175 /DNA_START=208 /DNA_END=1623 /DNA_ORIENTATION=-